MTYVAMIENLSPRQQDVLRHLCCGNGVKGTAKDLGIAYDTVKEYRRAVLRKMGVKTTEQAAVIAAKAGFC